MLTHEFERDEESEIFCCKQQPHSTEHAESRSGRGFSQVRVGMLGSNDDSWQVGTCVLYGQFRNSPLMVEEIHLIDAECLATAPQRVLLRFSHT